MALIQWLWIGALCLTLAAFSKTVNADDPCSIVSRPQNVSSCVGQITSPNYPAFYNNSATCQWLITSEETNGVVALTIDDFTLYNAADKLSIYDGMYGSSAPLIITLTGTYSVPVGSYVSTQRHMFIEFTSDASSNQRGFSATYRSKTVDEACSSSSLPARLTGAFGTIASPNYPDNYYGFASCQWLIQGNDDPFAVLTLDVDFLSTYEGSDYLRIYDGNSTSATQIVTLAGAYLTGIRGFTTTQNSMFVVFVSNTMYSGRGFSATFRQSSTGGACSPNSSPRLLLDDGLTFTTPNYPSAYYYGANCQWLLAASGDVYSVVTLDFDYLTTIGSEKIVLYDGNTTSSTQIATLSGAYATPPKGLTSTQKFMLVQLTLSTAATNQRGFSASLRTTTSGGACSSTYRPLASPDDVGTLMSPNYPNNYYDNADCQWLLKANGDYAVVTLQFEEFNTQTTYDIVYLFDGNSGLSAALATLSGQPTLGPYTSTQSNMFIRFTSNPSTNARGFRAKYRSTTTVGACTPVTRPRLIADDFGTVTSPNYPDTYYGSANCQWLITTASPSGIIVLDFDYLQTYSAADYVHVYNGSSTSSPRVAALSGSYPTPPTGITTVHYMFISFVSDATLNSRGFSATYRLSTNADTGNACNALQRPQILNKDGGSISSSNYPNNYNDDADCQWLIGATGPYEVVALRFDYFNIEVVSDFVYIYDGNSTSAPLIATLHGYHTSMPVFTTTQKYMFVRFTSDDTTNSVGFSASYKSTTFGGACSTSSQPRLLTESFGTFTSPNYPDSYYSQADCRWKIQTMNDPKGVIRLDFDYFDTVIERDFVDIYDGSSDTDPRIVRLHGSYSKTPGSYITTQQFMYVSFTAGDWSDASGFSATYQSVTSRGACSPTYKPVLLGGESGKIQSPGNATNYYDNADCSWLIESSSGSNGVIIIDFSYFDTETDADFVYIYDGDSIQAPLIARLHGSHCSRWGSYASTQQYLFIRFTSDTSTNSGGFTATFTSTASGVACSPSAGFRNLTGNGASFTSLNYPNNYNNFAECRWLLESSSELCQVVTLSFDYFYTEANADFVRIYDGISVDAPLIAELHGNYSTLPTGFNSTQRYMLVRFTSNGITTFGGFLATYKSTAASEAVATTPTTTTITTTTETESQETGLSSTVSPTEAETTVITTAPSGDGCTTGPRIVTGYSGTFTSPNYPGYYNDSADCQWLIVSSSPVHGVVSLDVVDFITQASYDFVYIYDGGSAAARLIDTLSGSKTTTVPIRYASTQQYMFIRFTSNAATNNRGFNFTFVSTSYGGTCSPQSETPILSANVGTLTTPNYPSTYYLNADCRWIIASTMGPHGIVTLDFDYFWTASSADIVNIYDGNSTSAKLIASLYGNLITSAVPPRGYRSTQPFMYITFKSDASVQTQSGFSATFTMSVTGGECSASYRPLSLTSYEGTFTSPNYPNNYYEQADCQWLITASTEPYGVVTLDFDDIITYNSNDRVYIYDGSSALSPLITSLYGTLTTLPKGISSTQKYMFVRFTSDGPAVVPSVRRGFSASYRTTNSGGACSSLFRPITLSGNFGSLTSHNYPYNYQDNADCQWLITSSYEYGVVTLYVEDIYVDGSDTLTIYDGNDASSPLITTLNTVSTATLGPFTTTLQNMFIRFTSSASLNYRGFRAAYRSTSTEGACTQLFRPLVLDSNFGSFSSPNYPDNYYHSANCRWLITASNPNEKITLDFDYFNTYDNGDVVYVYNGPTASSPLLATLYGSTLPTEISSTQRYMLVVFSSNTVNAARGFGATYRFSTSADTGVACSSLGPRLITSFGGTISSPNYPSSNYTRNADCGWLVVSPYEPDGVVSISFDFFYTEADYDFVHIYDGADDDAPLIAKLHGLYPSLPTGFTTTQRNMFVRFTSDESVHNGGFSASFRTSSFGGACSPSYRPMLTVNAAGAITSPNYPRNYYNKAYCEWLIMVPMDSANGVVTLDFNAFSTLSDSDYVYIYDGQTDLDPLIARLHGNHTYPLSGLTTTQRYMFVRFRSHDITRSSSGFSAVYRPTSSGGACSPTSSPRYFTGDGGKLSSPNDNYYNNAECSWRIESSAGIGGVVTLSFDFYNSQTDYDFLHIYDGDNDDDALITKLHGSVNALANNYATSQRYMFLKFTSDAEVNFNGFQATYHSTSYGGACTPASFPRNVTGHGATFTSPNFPNNYPNYADCRWLLVASVEHIEVVSLRFDYLNTEADADFVFVYDGSGIESSLIATLHGAYSTPPSGFNSTMHYMLVRFTSDSSTTYGGFSATYESVLPDVFDTTSTATPDDGSSSTTMPTTAIATTMTTDPPSGNGCTTGTGYLSDYAGTFSSLSYPSNANLNCNWLIAASSTDPFAVVALRIDDAYTYVSNQYIYVYDGSSSSSPRIGLLSGSYTGSVLRYASTQRYMYVSIVTGSGRLKATYTSTTYGGACSSSSYPLVLTAAAGSISSPNYPNNFNEGGNCQWLISTTDPYKTIAIEFQPIDMYAGDHIYIYDGNTTSSPQIANLAGAYSTPMKFLSTQYMLIWFAASSSPTYTNSGFTASYYTLSGAGGECAPLLRPRSMNVGFGSFTSPNYPYNYTSSVNCQWLLTAANDTEGVITLDFDSFNTQASYDVVTVYDGNSIYAPLIATLSGPTAPAKSITSSQKYMTVQFVSDVTIASQGFSVTYRTTQSGGACSPLLRPLLSTADVGSLTSPNYPNNYYANADCQWLINAELPYAVVSLNIDYCNTVYPDRLFIYDGNSVTATLMATLYGSAVNLGPYTTTRHSMFVRFVTDGANQNQGFSATYAMTTTGGACSPLSYPRAMNDTFGYFTSPNFPGNYYDSSDCQWLITARDADTVVTVDFDYFYTYNSLDVVYIYNGRDTSAPLLATLYGSYASPPSGITTTQKYMFVRFVSDTANNRRGFSAKYRSPPTTENTGGACSPSLRPKSVAGYGGAFASQNYPSNYSGDADCQWLLQSTVSPHGVVTLNFDYLQTQTDADFIYIHDGDSTDAPLIAKLHGYYCTPPTGFTTTQRYMFVRFTSDDATNAGGFSASYTSTTFGGAGSGLVLNLTGEYGTIATPNYPGNYYSSAYFQWLITSSAGIFGTVILDFEFFEIQTDYDFVYIYDGTSWSHPLIARLSGWYSTPPRGFTTTQIHMYIRFTAQGSTVFRGFRASYTSTSLGGAGSPDYRPRYLTGGGGVFLLPSIAGGNYYDNADCSWLIESWTVEYKVVTISFEYFLTQADADFLYIHDGVDAGASLIVKLHGTYQISAGIYTSSQKYMFVRFTSDSSINYGGFKAIYKSVSYGPACSPSYRPLTLLTSGGTLTSPNYPNSYYNNADCRWLLTSLSAIYEVVSIKFSYFYTQLGADYVFIYDGNDIDAPLIAVLHGDYPLTPAAINSSQQFMLVRFVSDGSIQYGGFIATYQSTYRASNSTGTPPTVTAPSTTTKLTTIGGSTTSTTSAPAPIIFPDPYVLVTLAGFFITDDTVNANCSDIIESEFQKNFLKVVASVNSAIGRKQLCAAAGGALGVDAGSVQFATHDNTTQVMFDVLVGINLPETDTVRYNEACSWEVNRFIGDIDNWPQPIVPSVDGCPDVVFDSTSFMWHSSAWKCV